MSRSLPPLNALKAFEAAARHVSFTLAAAELNVTHAAVSRHIRDLEAWLGIKLFVRTGRGVELTERGKGYAEELTRGFDILAHATDSASGRRRRRAQKLVVSVEPSFAALWLIPRLGRFTAANPDIELVLDSTSRLADFSRGEADAGIRYGRGSWPGIAAELLTATHMTPVCNPALLETSSIRAPADLPANLLLQEETRRYWMEWLTAVGLAALTIYAQHTGEPLAPVIATTRSPAAIGVLERVLSPFMVGHRADVPTAWDWRAAPQPRIVVVPSPGG